MSETSTRLDSWNIRQSRNCLARLKAWAATLDEVVITEMGNSRVTLRLAGDPSPMIMRRGQSVDEAAWYIINTLARLGIEVPALTAAARGVENAQERASASRRASWSTAIR